METRTCLICSQRCPQHRECFIGPSRWQLFRCLRPIIMANLRLLPPEQTACGPKWVYSAPWGKPVLSSAPYLLRIKAKHRVMISSPSAITLAGFLAVYALIPSLMSSKGSFGITAFCPAVASTHKCCRISPIMWVSRTLCRPQVTQPFGFQSLSFAAVRSQLPALGPWLVASSGTDGEGGRVAQGCQRQTAEWGCESLHCTDDFPLNEGLLNCHTQNKTMLFCACDMPGRIHGRESLNLECALMLLETPLSAL